MTAPIASGWSESPGGPRTHRKAPPFHGARRKAAVRSSAKSAPYGARPLYRMQDEAHQPANQRSPPCQEERGELDESEKRRRNILFTHFRLKIVTEAIKQNQALYTDFVAHFRVGSTVLAEGLHQRYRNERGNKYVDAAKSTYRAPELAPQSPEDGC